MSASEVVQFHLGVHAILTDAQDLANGLANAIGLGAISADQAFDTWTREIAKRVSQPCVREVQLKIDGWGKT